MQASRSLWFYFIENNIPYDRLKQTLITILVLAFFHENKIF